MKSVTAFSMRLIVGFCLCIGLVGGLWGQAQISVSLSDGVVSCPAIAPNCNPLLLGPGFVLSTSFPAATLYSSQSPTVTLSFDAGMYPTTGPLSCTANAVTVTPPSTMTITFPDDQCSFSEPQPNPTQAYHIKGLNLVVPNAFVAALPPLAFNAIALGSGSTLTYTLNDSSAEQVVVAGMLEGQCMNCPPTLALNSDQVTGSGQQYSLNFNLINGTNTPITVAPPGTAPDQSDAITVTTGAQGLPYAVIGPAQVPWSVYAMGACGAPGDLGFTTSATASFMACAGITTAGAFTTVGTTPYMVYAATMNSPVSMDANITVSSVAPTLSVSPTSQSVSWATGQGKLQGTPLQITTNLAIGASLGYSMSGGVCGNNWLTDTSGGTAGTVTVGSTTSLSFLVNGAQATNVPANGLCTGQITVSDGTIISASASVALTVYQFAYGTVPSFSVGLPGLAAPPPQQLNITSTVVPETFSFSNVSWGGTTGCPCGLLTVNNSPLNASTQYPASSPVNLGVSTTGFPTTPGSTCTATLTVTPQQGGSGLVLPSVTVTMNNEATLSATPTPAQGCPSGLCFTSAAGATPGNQTVTVSSSGASIVFTAAVNGTSNSVAWLQATENSSNNPQTAPPSPGTLTDMISISPQAVGAAGLPTGSYSGSLSFTCTASACSNTGAISVPVALNVTAALSAPQSVPITYTIGGSLPGSVPINVTSNGGAIVYTAAPQQGNPAVCSDLTGLTGSFTAGGSSPSSPSVGLSSAVTQAPQPAAGPYACIFALTPSFSLNQPTNVTVMVNINETISISPTSIQFTAISGNLPTNNSMCATVTGSDSKPYTSGFSASYSNAAPWLSLPTYPGAGVVCFSVATAQTSAPPQALVTITPSNQNIAALPNALTISLSLQAYNFSFSPATPTAINYTIGGTTPAAQTVTITSTGQQINNITATPSATWLTSTLNGTSTPTGMSLALNTAGLSVGPLSANVSLTGNSAGVSGTYGPVSLTVSSISVSPQSLTFPSVPAGSPSQPPTQTLTVSDPNASAGSSVSFTAVASTTSGGNWLTVTPAGPTVVSTPKTLTVSVNSAGLQPGSYSGSITIAGTAQQTLFTVAVSFAVTSNALTLAPATPLTFGYQLGGTAPACQVVDVTATPGVTFSVSAASSPSGWLTATPASGNASTTATAVTVCVNPTSPTALAAAQYQGTLTYTAPTGSTSTTTQQVYLTVRQFSATPSGVTFNYQSGGTIPAAQTVNVGVSDFSLLKDNDPLSPSIPWAATQAVPAGNSTTASECNALTVSPVSGNTFGGTPPNGFAVTPVQSGFVGLQAGTYNCTVTVSGTGIASQGIPVSIVVTPARIQVGGQANFVMANTAPAVTTILTVSVNGSSYPFNVTYETSPATAKWLTIGSPSSGTTTGTFELIVNPAQLVPGMYSTPVSVTVTGVGSIDFYVNLTVSGANLAASPNTLSFTYQPGGTIPAAQSIAVTPTNNVKSVALSSVASSVSWLQATSLSSAPGTVTVTVNPALLAAGSYVGQILFTGVGSPTASLEVPVNLTVLQQPALVASPSALSFSAAGAGSQLQCQNVALTSATPVGFTVAVGAGASWVTVNPGSGTTPATLVVCPSTANLPATTYSTSITASATGVGAVGPASIAVKLTVGIHAVPVIASGLINAASGAVGTVAPGMAVSIFGTNLGPPSGVSFAAPPTGGAIATTLGGTQVLFDGVPVPMLYTESNQVNALVPFELNGKTSTVLEVVYGNETSVPVTLEVVPALPGLFTMDGSGKGQGSILNQDYSINSASNPAAPGSVIQIFGTGGGATVPPSVDGALNPIPPPFGALALPVTVTIGGQPAQLYYAGPAPGLLGGIMQIDAFVPSGLASGAQSVVVQVGNIASQALVTVAV